MITRSFPITVDVCNQRLWNFQGQFISVMDTKTLFCLHYDLITHLLSEAHRKKNCHRFKRIFRIGFLPI
jgi:hypothetical protein